MRVVLIAMPSGLENVRAMVGEIGFVARIEWAQSLRRIEPKTNAIGCRQMRGDQHLPCIVERNEALVECCIKMRSEELAVELVASLGRCPGKWCNSVRE
jgi:hypothetical protein